MGEIIRGKDIALSIKEDIKKFVLERKEKNLAVPKIASIVVGNDGGSIFYVNSQEKVATSLGLEFEKIFLKEDIKEEELIQMIIELNERNDISGIMLQVPLPKGFDEKKIISYLEKKYNSEFKIIEMTSSGEHIILPEQSCDGATFCPEIKDKGVYYYRYNVLSLSDNVTFEVEYLDKRLKDKIT